MQSSSRSRLARGWCNRPQYSHINPPNIGAGHTHTGAHCSKYSAQMRELMRCWLGCVAATGSCARATCGAISRPMGAGCWVWWPMGAGMRRLIRWADEESASRTRRALLLDLEHAPLAPQLQQTGRHPTLAWLLVNCHLLTSFAVLLHFYWQHTIQIKFWLSPFRCTICLWFG